jgi:hypothetical protein
MVLAAVAVGAAGQLLLLGAAQYHWAGLFVAGVGLAGIGLGTAYALLPRVVNGFFGDESAMANFGVLYSAKGIGGVLGVGVVAVAGGSAGFVAAAVFALACLVLVPALHQPGRTLALA